jgi:beta-lactam-binding protein with PASTA domain
MATGRDPDGVVHDAADSDDEATLADEEWPVADLYRIEPPDEDVAPVDPGEEAGTVFVEQPAAEPGGFRRFPEAIGPGLVAALLGILLLLLLIPAGLWLASRGDDSAGGTARADAPTSPPPTTDAPSTSPPASPAERTVPDVVGTPLARARERIEDAGLQSRFRRVDSERPRDEVLSQTPEPGAEAERRSFVVLTISSGETRIAVPDVEGMSASDAVRALRDAGLEPRTRATPSDEPAGTVLEQEPAAGEEVADGTTVVLRIAEGRAQPPPAAEAETVRVPALVGMPAADARSRLRELGLRVTQRPVESSQPAGEVVSQSPAADAEVREGAVVTLRVSTGPAGVAVPDVVGLDETAAAAELEAAGFTVRVADEPTLDPTQAGVVLRQSPAAGTTRDEGATVTITVGRAS